jgi:hypothetical protein
VQNMIRVCKTNLEEIGLEITSMHIADVGDHRLDGVKDAAKEETEARRADVTIRNLEHERESLLAATRVKVAAERQRSAIGVQKAPPTFSRRAAPRPWSPGNPCHYTVPHPAPPVQTARSRVTPGCGPRWQAAAGRWGRGSHRERGRAAGGACGGNDSVKSAFICPILRRQS